MVRVARAGLRDAKHMRVEPERPGRAHAPGVRRIAQLDRVDHPRVIAVGRELAEGALADREGQVRQGMRHDRHAARLVDPRERLRERGEHRHLVLDPQSEEMARSCGDLDTGNHLDGARSPCREVAQLERAADVVVIGERDHIEPGALGRLENLLDR